MIRHKLNRDHRRPMCAAQLCRCNRTGFTLVELLVVLFVFLLLASIALPTFKNLLVDQKASRSASNVIAFFEAARSRAIADNRPVGVRIERIERPGGTDAFGRAASIRLRQLIGVPPYAGDSSDAVARLSESVSGGGIDRAEFDANDSPLLLLSSTILNTAPTSDDNTAPIRLGDQLELPGGRTVPIGAISHAANTVTVAFNLRELDGTIATFPGGIRSPNPITNVDPVKYRIHRRPVPSSTETLDLLPGLAIDLNFSGVAIGGNDFHPSTTTSDTANDIDIVFATDGSIASVTSDMVVGSFGPPMGHIYLCLGKLDGVISNGQNLFQKDNRVTSNLMNLDSIWLKLNPKTGEMVASPFASVSTIPAVTNDPADAGVDVAVAEARSLAQVSATLEGAP